MTRHSVEDWAALSALLDRALEVPSDDRPAWIASLPSAYDGLRARLRDLLSGSADLDGDLLDTLPKLGTSASGSTDIHHDAAPSPGVTAPYRILCGLGHGGMGTVWLAHRTDVMVNRTVALKLPRRTGLGGAGLAQRIADEREILASLNHPNIARLYDAGICSDGHPYLALEYIKGRPIDAYAAANSLSIPDRLRLFLSVTRALAHAHSRLVIHRDLKPSNILVIEGGDVKLLDFGIARLLDDGGIARDASGEHRVHLFTPEYASPEQIAGRPLTVATDIYSSGLVLYELLTGVRHDRRAHPERPLRPSIVAASASTRRVLRGDLDAVLLKALASDPDDRYTTIDAFADDIERHLASYPVLAHTSSAWYRLRRLVFRNRLAVSAGAAVLVAVLTGTAVAAWQAHVAVQEKAHALEVKDFVVTLFGDASPYGARGRGLSAIDWLKHARIRIDARLDDRVALKVELLNIVGSSLLNLQDTAAAQEALAQAVDLGVRRLGRDHPLTLRARVLMTPVRRFQGRTTEMRAELSDLLPILRRTEDSLAEALVIALKNQAHLELDEGHYAEAERAALEAVDVAGRRLGETHPETVAALLMQAYTYQFSRTPDVALPAARRAYERAMTVFRDAPNHPRTIEGRLLYGRALGEAGQRRRGVEQLAAAVRDAAEVLGSSSRMVGFFSVPLAEFQTEVGETDRAIVTSSRAVTIIARHTEPQSFRFAAALHQRGASLLAARRAADALPDLTTAARIVEQVLSPRHEMTRWFQADEALALARVGRVDEARARLRPLLPAPDSPMDAAGGRALFVLGMTERLAGDRAEGLRTQRRALEGLATGDGAAIRRMRVLTEIGVSLIELDRVPEAVGPLREALALSHRFQTQQGPDRIDILDALQRAGG
jgi:eukaryotic-like serine/threonine-protein kinase